MRISKNVSLGSAMLAAAGIGVAVETPSINVTAHADTGHTQNTDKTPSAGDNSTGNQTVKTIDDAYEDIQGDTAHDTNASQHSSQSWEYMNPDDAAKDWQHKEDWEKEPGTDNTQTDWSIAQNTNGKNSVDTSADVAGDVATGAFNPGDIDSSKMTSLKWVDRDHDGDGEEEWVEGPDDRYYLYNRSAGSVYDTSGNLVDGSLAAIIVDNNNNNNNNNSSNNNSSNNNALNNGNGVSAAAGKGASANVDGTNGQGANGQFNNANAVKQIGQNIEGNDHNLVGQPLVINGGNASGLAGDGNGTYVIGADGIPVLVDNNNNNNNNNNGNNGNNNNGNNTQAGVGVSASAGSNGTTGSNDVNGSKATKDSSETDNSKNNAADPAKDTKSDDNSKNVSTSSKTDATDATKEGQGSKATGNGSASGANDSTAASTGVVPTATSTSAVGATDGSGVASGVAGAELPQTGDSTNDVKAASAIGGIMVAAFSAYGVAKKRI